MPPAVLHSLDVGNLAELHAEGRLDTIVAKAVEILLSVEGVVGEVYNCYDRYISECQVASLAKKLSGSDSEVRGSAGSPKHQIVTDKLRRLGMEFGGEPLLEQTVRQMLDTVTGHRRPAT